MYEINPAILYIFSTMKTVESEVYKIGPRRQSLYRSPAGNKTLLSFTNVPSFFTTTERGMFPLILLSKTLMLCYLFRVGPTLSKDEDTLIHSQKWSEFNVDVSYYFFFRILRRERTNSEKFYVF